MNELDKIITLFDNAIMMDFHKFGTLLMQQAEQRNIAACCEAILQLRLKLKPHFKRLADFLRTSLACPEDYNDEERRNLQAIYEMAQTLCFIPTGYEQTTITDELKNINIIFEEAGWVLPDAPRILGNFGVTRLVNDIFLNFVFY